METIASWLVPFWTWLQGFLTSSAFTALSGGIAGAFFGAWGAERIASRARFRERLTKEIRDTNAAINVAYSICNSLLSIKRQHIKPLQEKWQVQRDALLEYKRKMDAGEIPPGSEFHYSADLESLALPPLPLDVLQALVFERVSLIGRPLNLTTTLSQTIHGVTLSLQQRNALIDAYKAGQPALTPALYFGLPQRNQINADYPSIIAAIYHQTDDGIFFSELLTKDLMAHGNELATRYEEEFGEAAPPISEVEFGSAEQAGLIPSAAPYADWLTKFKKKPPRPSPGLVARLRGQLP